jgi:hypothetical protein
MFGRRKLAIKQLHDVSAMSRRNLLSSLPGSLKSTGLDDDDDDEDRLMMKMKGGQR